MEDLILNENHKEEIMVIEEDNEVIEINEGGETGGTSNYNDLIFKPKINGVELTGDKSPEDLKMQAKLTAGENVEIKNNVISVMTANKAEENNTKPITAAAVYTEVGNISVLLQTI